MYKVLFICTHNSARSQIAEAYLRQLSGDRFQVESAGFEPGEINPDVIAVLKEEGIDISRKTTQKVFDVYKQGRIFHFVITVCEQEEAWCPLFPGMTHRLHLPFPVPSAVPGEREERLVKVRQIRDRIKVRIEEFIRWVEDKENFPLGDMWEFRPVS